ncbi:MAG: carbohydrate binding domain-containing protein [Verrucomicrobiales bacterium]
MFHKPVALVCALVFCGFPGAQNTPAGEIYQFPIDRDGLAGAPACKLNSPIRTQDRIHVKNGHFYTVGIDEMENTGDDRRVRFWGINLTAPLSFPRTMAEAERLATRFEKLGINIVRLHSFDNSKDKPSYLTVLDTGARYPVLNEENMKCMDRLLKAFAHHGIYAHFALHVSYTFDTRDAYRDEQGEHRIPDPAETTARYPKAVPMPRGSGSLLIFNREMIELQKRFTEIILSRKNHLTGVLYQDDPVIASLELNNENSLVERFQAQEENFPPLYAAELDRLWLRWLRTRYGSDQSLSRAWDFKQPEGKPPGLANGNFDDAPGGVPSSWTLHRLADARPPEGDPQHKENDWGMFEVSEAGALEVTVSKVPPIYWHIFAAQQGIHLSEGNVYRIRLKAWADTPRKIQISCQGEPDTSRQAFRKWRVAITTVPKFYEMTFTSTMQTGSYRLNILPLTSDHPYKPGDNAGRIRLDDITIERVKPYSGLRPVESLDSYIARPASAGNASGYPSPRRRMDYLRFLSDTERSYYRELKTWLREGIGAKQPVTGSQANYGGFLGHQVMSEEMDFVDTHSYYDHCHFPPSPHWDEWTYTNVPMVENPRASVIGAITGAFTEDMPFTITEYGPNPFNQYMIESYSMVPAYAAFQDIDAIFIFHYFRSGGDFRDNMNPSRLTGVHNVLGDTRAEVLMNLAATLFRRGLVKPARHLLSIPISDEQAFNQVYRGENIRSLQSWLEGSKELRDPAGKNFDVRMGLVSRIRIRHQEREFKGFFPQLPVAQEDPQTGKERVAYVSDTGELRWMRYPQKGSSHFIIDTAQAKVVAGYLKRKIQLSGVTISGTGNKGQFGLVSIVSMDGKPVTESSDLLITSLGGGGKGRNLQVVEVDPARKRYRMQLPDGRPFYIEEAGPFEIETNPVTITLSNSSTPLSLERLGTDGSARSKREIAGDKGQFTFTVGGAADRTPWYRVRVPQSK